MIQISRYDDTSLPQPQQSAVPDELFGTLCDLFDTWSSVRARNARLTRYYEMRSSVKDFGIAIPPQLARVDEVVGWAQKAVDVRVNRSVFDGFVFRGKSDPTLDALVTANRMRQLVRQTTRSMLTHGCAAMTVMRGTGGQPAAKVRAYSANQCCMLWDKDADGISAGIVLADVDRLGRASRYVLHLPERVLVLSRPSDDSAEWALESDERNPVGAMLMVPLVTDEAKRLRAYLGSIWAITRDENGDVPTVGQFPAGDAQNFIATYENDAQRFSGASLVPLAQLGVMGNTYTSSDALSASNDPLILDVQGINDGLRDSLWQVARLMMAVSGGVTLDELTPEQDGVMASFADPSMPTLASRADAWTKLAGIDPSIVGTRVFYEGMGLDQATIDRLMAAKEDSAQAIAYRQIFAGGTKRAACDGGEGEEPPQPSEVDE